MDFLHRVQAVVVLDATGRRVFAKYYTGEDAPASSKMLAPVDRQRALEQQIQQAVRDPKIAMNTVAYSRSEILVVDGHSVFYQFGDDVTFIVIGDSNENEQVLSGVLTTFVDVLKQCLNTPSVNNRMLLENYDALLLTVDEMLDEGIILETNPSNIAAEIEPYLIDTGSESARKALTTVNKYLRENL